MHVGQTFEAGCSAKLALAVAVLQLIGRHLRSLAASFTVAILAQGTSWAVAVTQAFLLPGSILVGCTWEIVHGVAKPSAC